MKEITLSKAIMPDRDVEGIIIKINEDIPSLTEMSELYNPDGYFKEEAMELADALYSSLPVTTVKELLIILTKRMYRLEENL